MILTLFRFILWACLSICLYSSYVLAVTKSPEQGLLNVNMEKALENHSNPSFIQQIKPWLLSSLKYKIVFIIMVIAMICMLYENDSTSLSQKPSKAHKKKVPRKNHSDQQQGSFIESLQLDSFEKITQPDIEKMTGRFDQSKMIKNKVPETRKQHKPLNVAKRKVQKEPCLNSKSECSTTSSIDPKLLQQNKMIKNQVLETQKQQKPLNVSKKKVQEEPCLNSKSECVLAESLEPKTLLMEGKKSNIHKVSARTKSSWSEILRADKPKDGWTNVNYKGEWVYIYISDLDSKKRNIWWSISEVTVLSNSFIPFQHGHQLWINSKFSTKPDLAVLATTSKSSYLQFKKLPDMGKKRATSYMDHPAYKTCVIHMFLRVEMAGARGRSADISKYESEFTSFASVSFESVYEQLLKMVNGSRIVSYESFRAINLVWRGNNMTTAKHFLTRKFLSKREWKIEELNNSKDALKEEFIQAIKEFEGFQMYDFIPPVDQGVDEVFYKQTLERMKLEHVPFCNCPNISRLIISSRYAPLKLFLFWDIFDGLKMELLSLIRMMLPEKGFIKNHGCIIRLKHSIDEVYKSQNANYLSKVYFEMVDFFDGSELHQPLRAHEPHLIPFDDYVLGIRAKVEAFLIEVVFASPLVAIRV